MRLETIRRANNLLYEQNDKMKVLRSQMLYSDVLHDRTKQIEVKKKNQEDEKIVEQHYHEEILKQVKRGEEEEERKKRAKEQRTQEVIKTREQQLNEVRQRRAEEAEEQKRIGQSMKQEAERQCQETLKEQEDRREYIAKVNHEMVDANEELKRIRRDLQAKERLAEEARDAEKTVIENRKKALKALEIRRFEKQQETRNQLIERAVEELKKKVNNENAVLQKQQDELRDKEDRKFAAKEAQRQREKELILASRQEQILRRMHEREQQEIEEDEMVRVAKIALEEGNRAEAMKIAKEKDTVKQLKAIQLAEAATKQRKKVEDRLSEIEQENIMHSLSGQDDHKFKDVCVQKIQEYQSQGKPVYPLYRALETTAPEILPAKTVKVKRQPKE